MRILGTIVITILAALTSLLSYAQPTIKVKKADLKKDVIMFTNKGNMTLRLSDSTALHRDNFIRLIKS